jgi:CRISPR-associated protein Csd1
MLLKALYELAHSRNLLDDPAFTRRAVRWVIALDADGNLLGITPTGDEKRGKEFSVPQTSRPKVAGGVAEFLADGITAVFGLDSDPEEDKDNEKRRRDRDQNNADKCDDFWQQIQTAYDVTKNPSLNALINFRKARLGRLDFLKWEARENQKPAWWLKTAAGNEVKLKAENFTFEVAGKLLIEDEATLRPYWRKIYQREVSDRTETVEKGLCLVTGRAEVPIAPTAPKIKGVPNTQAFGAAIVSFDKPAFDSYGADQNYNAPTSIDAALAYPVALNWLLNRRNHSLRLGGTVICFWAREYEEATDIFAELFEKPKPETVQRFLTSPSRGTEHRGVHADEFYSVTLAGNAGRIVVRQWLQCPLETATENLRRWFADLQIATFGEVSDESQPFSLYNLAKTTVRVKKDGRIDQKDLQPELLTQLYRAALEGQAPSVMLLKPILNRFAKELARDGPNFTLRRLSRFALLRLILNRQLRKEGKPEMEAKVFETDDAAYNCGRLLSIFDDLQMRASEYQLEGAGVVERYYGSASSAPNSAFGILWRLHQHHLKKFSRQGDKGKAAAEAIKRRIAGIAALFPQPKPNVPPQFPRAFSLVEQGRFALGFYQQKAFDDAARRAAMETSKHTKRQQPGTNSRTEEQNHVN